MPTFTTPGPILVSLDLVGDTRITASDRHDTVVVVRPRDSSKAGDVKAAEQTIVEYADGRLRLKTPKHWSRYTPFGGGESIDVSIEVPTGSRVEGTTGMGDFHGEGELGSCRLKTAMGHIRLDHTADLRAVTSFGNITVDHVAGDADASTGSGDLRIGEVDGTAVIKNSNGDSELGLVAGEASVKSANGDISIGRALTSVTARTSNGDVRIGDVRHGTIVLQTAVGELTAGVHDGVAAWLDLHSRFGSVRNDLDAADGPHQSDRTVEVRAHTPCGDIVVTRSRAEPAASATPQSREP